MEETTIHKVRLTPEIRVDYSVVNENDLPSNELETMKFEVEDYITHNNRVWNKHYFKLKYIDETLDKELYVFIKRKTKILSMQNWELVGTCECQYWSEDDEEEGRIRAWIDTKVEDIPNEPDWVEEMYKHKIIDKMEEIYDYAGRDFYIESREIVARELSRQYSDDSGHKEIEPKRVKYYLNKRGVNSGTTDAILKQLDSLLDRAREKIDRNDL